MKLPDYVVRCHGGAGRGVLVGDVILTAAHCLCNQVDASAAWGATFAEPVQTQDGVIILTRPIAVEPCADIAVLGAHDHPDCEKHFEAFETFCQKTKPLPLARHPIKPRKKIPVRILGRDGRWIKGEAEILNEHSR